MNQGEELNLPLDKNAAKNEKDYEYFMARNPFIMPNPNVVEVFLKFLEMNT